MQKLIAAIILSVSCASAAERSAAVLLLPFRSETLAQCDLGIGIHNLLESMALQHGGLKETWAISEYRNLFPAPENLAAYRLGRGEPKGIESVPHRWVIIGRMRSNRLELDLVDRVTSRRTQRRFRWDAPEIRATAGEIRATAGVVRFEDNLPLINGLQPS